MPDERAELAKPEDAEFLATYGAWAERTERDAQQLLAEYSGTWWVAGGRALEAWSGLAREHGDIDVAILRQDLSALRTAVASRMHVWAAFGGALKPLFPGDPDQIPEQRGNIWLGVDATRQWEYDVLLNPGESGRWVNRRVPSMSMPLDQATWTGDCVRGVAGVRYLQPEIVLLFKAKHLRARDEADFSATVPLLDPSRRRWLSDALQQAHPGHPWLRRR